MSRYEEHDFRGRAQSWTGRSGRRYSLVAVEDRANMQTGRLYALAAADGVIGWAGTAEDLISDPVSRERFRRVGTNGTHMFSMPAIGDPLAIMTLVWDLEGSNCRTGRHAA